LNYLILSVGILISVQVLSQVMSSSTSRERQQERDNEYSNNTHQQEHDQHDATIRSIDETKDNIHRSIEESRRELPRYSQTVTDFQNETADASMEITDNFLESQKEVIHSMQSAWAPMAERIGQAANFWTSSGVMSFFSPSEMTNIYARTIGAMAEAYAASTRMATNMMFAGLEATRTTTNYARQNAKEASRISSNTARAFAQTTKETVEVQDQEQRGVSSTGGSISSFGEGGAGSAASSFEQRGGHDRTTTTTATIAREDTVDSSGETGSTTATRIGTTTETATAATDIGERQEKSNRETRK
jgi:hypothetical protein